VDKDLAEEAEREIVGHSGLRFAHVEPLKVQGRSAGILMVGTLQDQAFSPDEREQLRVLAGYLSLAVEKMQLLSMVDLGKRELDTLNRIGAALASSTFAADKVLEYTLDLVSASTHAEAACVLMREDDELTFRAVFQLDIEILKNTRLKMGQGLAGYCAARGEPVILGQQRDPIHLTPAVDAVTGFTTRNALAVPLIVHGKVIGVIEVLNKVGGEFSERESKLLQSIAGSVSIALENARLYQQIVADAENERAIRNVFQKFVPRVVVDKILQGAGTGTEGGIDEFKRITLLNIDIRGFSSMAKKVGPHQSVALLNEFFATMGSIVVLHGGIVDKYLGDGFLALFGAPVSTAHDADNAILSALLMRHALDQLNRTLPAEYGGEVSIGIAIHTGEVIVGNIGFEKKMDYTVIGDSVNAVFRLQNLTRNYPNGILITESTRRASMSFLNLREAGAYDIDATGGPLEIFEVIGINSKNRNEVQGKNEDGETRDGEEKTAIAT
jgi:adenylate cyclase